MFVFCSLRTRWGVTLSIHPSLEQKKTVWGDGWLWNCDKRRYDKGANWRFFDARILASFFNKFQLFKYYGSAKLIVTKINWTCLPYAKWRDNWTCRKEFNRSFTKLRCFIEWRSWKFSVSLNQFGIHDVDFNYIFLVLKSFKPHSIKFQIKIFFPKLFQQYFVYINK